VLLNFSVSFTKLITALTTDMFVTLGGRTSCNGGACCGLARLQSLKDCEAAEKTRVACSGFDKENLARSEAGQG
jgi:hypothetical protein